MHNLKRLEFSRCKELKALPHNLGALTQLRSLDLSETGIQELPDTLTSYLYKLESVNLGSICKFPKDIKNWVELRSFIYSGKTNGATMPRGLEKLTRLEELVPYLVRKDIEVSTGTSYYSTSSSIQELADLNSLRKLKILNLENVRGKIDAERANLKDKQNIKDLTLQWEPKEGEGDDLAVAITAAMVLEGLQPHPNLEIFYINGFPGLEPPKWMASSSSLPNLVKLTFHGNKCENLVSLGQLSCLKILHILHMNSVKCLGKEFYQQEEVGYKGSSAAATTTLFPSLTELRIQYMEDLEEWVAPSQPDNSFPCLEILQISFCNNLTSIPDLSLWASTLRHLDISSCFKLKESIALYADGLQRSVKDKEELDMLDLFSALYGAPTKAS
ncbi:putative disease resistance protein At3g14460 [Papaver somniferum]|uniref:putative disease resistance protein At3g14460 n=1 Tax=Papaver somniferum TaxID=3469 RepID=UPI000E6F7E4E|nr:putative disease resistance protein At3g14460 [Papaver somniferum]